jgi:hypothetical protein
MKTATIVAVWLAVSAFNFGALNAEMQSISCYDARNAAGVCAFFALIPVAGSFAAIFTTGFFEHGFRYSFSCPDGVAK